MEECAELIAAANHLLRELEGADKEFLEELADVHIALLQQIEYFKLTDEYSQYIKVFNEKYQKLKEAVEYHLP